MKVQIWSDVVCPHCYIGKRNFEAAMKEFIHRDKVKVEWKSFELDPQAPKNTQANLAKLLGQKYGKGPEAGQRMIDHTVETARKAGVELNLEKAILTNSFNAHRLIHLAAKHQKQDAAVERLFVAHMLRGEDIGRDETLRQIGEELGLPGQEVLTVLSTDEFADQVRKDENEAYHLQVRGVPFYLFEKRLAVPGAHSKEQFLAALKQAWDKFGHRKSS